jgi:hypothetical protein
MFPRLCPRPLHQVWPVSLERYDHAVTCLELRADRPDRAAVSEGMGDAGGFALGDVQAGVAADLDWWD